MSELDSSKVNPIEAMRKIDRMRSEDMKRYSDPASGELRSEIAEQVNNCPACDSVSSEAVLLFKKDAFKFFKCKECSHVYVNPRLADAQTGLLYSEGRCFYQLKEFYLPTAEYRKERIYGPKLSLIEEKIEKGALLDFGSSTGYFMQTALERGWQVSGVELNPFGVKWAREKLGLDNVFNQDINECGFAEDQFDVITLWDVVEHIPEPYPILQSLRRYIKDSGLMVVETSHFDCLETEILGKENTNLVGDMHVMHFTRESLTRLLKRAGFKVTDIEIFGLDLRHILNYQELAGDLGFSIPDSHLNSIQSCIDSAGKGCYIKAYAVPN